PRRDRAVAAAVGVVAVAVDRLDLTAVDRGDNAVVLVGVEVADVAGLGVVRDLAHRAAARAAHPGPAVAAAGDDRPGGEDAAPADQPVGVRTGLAVVLAVLHVLDDLLGERGVRDGEDLGQRLPAGAGLVAGLV